MASGRRGLLSLPAELLLSLTDHRGAFGLCANVLTPMGCQFMYVWVLVLLIRTFAEPAYRLIETIPTYSQLHAKIVARCSPPPETEHEQTLAATFEMQERLSSIFLGFMTALIFGVVTPLLPLVALLGSWLNFCSLVWVSHTEQDVQPFGQLLAATVMVQPPITSIQMMVMGLVVVLSVFIFVDMSFDIGPFALYVVFNSILIPLSFVRPPKWILMCCKINDFMERTIFEDVSEEGCQDGEETTEEKDLDFEIEFNMSSTIACHAFKDDDFRQELPRVESNVNSPESPSSEGLSDMVMQTKILSKYSSVKHALQNDTLAPQQEAALKRVQQLFLKEHAEPLRSEFITPRKPAAAGKQAKGEVVKALASSRSHRSSSPTRPRSGSLQPKAAATPRFDSISKGKKTQNRSQLDPNTTPDRIKRTRQARQRPSTPKNINADAKSAADCGLVSPRYSSKSARGTKEMQPAKVLHI